MVEDGRPDASVAWREVRAALQGLVASPRGRSKAPMLRLVESLAAEPRWGTAFPTYRGGALRIGLVPGASLRRGDRLVGLEYVARAGVFRGWMQTHYGPMESLWVSSEEELSRPLERCWSWLQERPA